MAIYNPPTEQLPIFNARVFIPKPNDGITTAEGDLRYLRFPAAQGSETLQDITVIGSAAFTNSALPTSAGVLPAPTTISTQIPTMTWVQQAITAGGAGLLTSNNNWTGTNEFSNVVLPTSTAALPLATDSSTKIPTTQWVQSAITAGGSLLGSNNTWTGTNDFVNTGTGSLTSSATQPLANDSSTTIPTTAWVQTAITAGGSLLGSNNTWTNQNTFTISSYATYSIPAFSNDTTIATTAWATQIAQYYYNLGIGGGITNPLQASLLYGHIPYTFDLQFATFNPALTTNPLQQSFACSVMNNTFAYSTNMDFVWWSEPQKPAVSAATGANAYPSAASTQYNSVQLSGDGFFALICNDGLGASPSNVYRWAKDLGIATTSCPSGYWWDSALSLTGQYGIVCSCDGTKGLYVSNDYCINFTEITPVGVFTSVAISAGGKYMVGLDQLTGAWVSNDFGATFTLQSSVPSDWCNVCMSANGQYMMAVPNFTAGIPNDSILSFDFGQTWNNFGTPLMTITNCCMSDDGLMWIIFNGATAYQSFSYGVSWSLVPNNLSFRQMTGTAAGAKARFAQRNKYLLGWTAGGMPYYAEFTSNW